MKTDRIFVLLLVVMLPMSGCFDDAVGDADAEEDSSGTTVINNYYNNTTNIVDDAPIILAIGGLSPAEPADFDNSYAAFVTVAQINTSALEMIEVVESDTYSPGSSHTFTIYSNCSNGLAFANSPSDFDNPYPLPGSAFSCTHELSLRSGSTGVFGAYNYPANVSWSFAYKVIPVIAG